MSGEWKNLQCDVCLQRFDGFHQLNEDRDRCCPECFEAGLRLAPAERRSGHSKLVYDKEKRTIVTVSTKQPPPVRHSGECETDEYARTVCEGMYVKRTDELLGLVEALRAIRALAGGYGEQAKAITKLVDDAIKEHAAWTR